MTFLHQVSRVMPIRLVYSLIWIYCMWRFQKSHESSWLLLTWLIWWNAALGHSNQHLFYTFLVTLTRVVHKHTLSTTSTNPPHPLHYTPKQNAHTRHGTLKPGSLRNFNDKTTFLSLQAYSHDLLYVRVGYSHLPSCSHQPLPLTTDLLLPSPHLSIHSPWSTPHSFFI